MLEHILVATDLSEAALSIYPHAAYLARAFGAKVTLLHVDELATGDLHEDTTLTAYLDEVADAMREGIELAAETFAKAGIAHDVEVIAGTASTVTAEYAGRQGVDIIVMARHGTRDRSHSLVGRTTKRLVRSSTVPVLVVPAAEQIHDPVAYDRIVTSTDFSKDSRLGLDAAVDLAKQLSAEVFVVHVMEVPSVSAGKPGKRPLVMPRQVMDGSRATRQSSLDSLVAPYANGRVQASVVQGRSAPEALVDAARTAHLLAIPSHGKGAMKRLLFGSTTERVLELADKPILVMPRTWLRGR